MDGAESVRSGRSERSDRSHRSHNSHSGRHRQPGSRSYHRSRSSDGQRNNYHDRGDRDRDDRSVTIKAPGSESCDDDHREERIEVQILPQDDNWGDNTTAITGNTSETGFSMEDMHKFSIGNFEENLGFDCARYVGTALAAVLSIAGFISPIVMVILPRLGFWNWDKLSEKDKEDGQKCLPECEGLLISFAFKLLILKVGTVALFFRAPKATMPRVFVCRAIVLLLVFVLTFAFWLFYGVRIFKEQNTPYYQIVQFSVSLVDALLFIHYIAIILLEIRHLQPQYVLKVVRSPDGVSKCYTVGVFSIQRAAAWVLEQYYRDFDVYNPYLENATKRPTKLTGFKVYDVDGNPNTSVQGRSRAIFAATARRRDASHNDRFYEEQDYDRRVRKRRARLLVAAEEAFTHIKRMQDEQGKKFLTICIVKKSSPYTSPYVPLRSAYCILLCFFAHMRSCRM